MSEKTGIAWTDHTFNPWWGCTKVSDACDFCYAERDSKRYGFDLWGSRADRRFFGDKHWAEPLKWQRKAAADGVRRRVFCASMADIFEDRRDLDDSRARLWTLVAATPHLDWLLLSKRPELADKLTPGPWVLNGWPRNAWAGTTVERREWWSRVEALKRIPALTRFLSIEPMLEAMPDMDLRGIAWAIFGGESGSKARPMDPAWVADGIGQCRTSYVAPFVKQMGRWILGTPERPELVCSWLLKDGSRFVPPIIGPRVGVRPTDAVAYSLPHQAGANPDEWPMALRVREFPA